MFLFYLMVYAKSGYDTSIFIDWSCRACACTLSLGPFNSVFSALKRCRLHDAFRPSHVLVDSTFNSFRISRHEAR
jgi:hypothetical protein